MPPSHQHLPPPYLPHGSFDLDLSPPSLAFFPMSAPRCHHGDLSFRETSSTECILKELFLLMSNQASSADSLTPMSHPQLRDDRIEVARFPRVLGARKAPAVHHGHHSCFMFHPRCPGRPQISAEAGSICKSILFFYEILTCYVSNLHPTGARWTASGCGDGVEQGYRQGNRPEVG